MLLFEEKNADLKAEVITAYGKIHIISWISHNYTHPISSIHHCSFYPLLKDQQMILTNQQ